MGSVISWLMGGGRTQASGWAPTDDRWYEPAWGGTMSRAGTYVSPDTARRISAVYRCVNLLAGLLAMFPKHIYEKTGPRSREQAPDHPLDEIISLKPNRRQTAFEFWQLLCHHLVLRQNAYVQIVQGRPGEAWVGELVPLHPDRVTGPDELPDGRLRYEYRRGDGRKFTMMGGTDIWHLKGLSDDGLRGLSMIDLARDSFGTSLAAERHAATFFEQGVKVSGVLQSDKTLKAEVAEKMGDSFREKWGGQGGVGSVPVLWEGVKFEPVSMTLKDAEFLDSRKFSVAEIARWFGVPPHLIGDVERSTSWGTGLSEQNLAFLTYTLQAWMELIEQSTRYTLIIRSGRYYMKINAGALLRMAPEKQADVFDKLIKAGVLNPNECRELMDRNPRDGGDEYVDPAKNVARSNADVGGGKPSPPEPPPGAEEDGDGEEDDSNARAALMAKARHRELLEEEADGLARIAKRHAKTSEAWRGAVFAFYGRFAKRIEETGISSAEKAREWCLARREVVVTNARGFERAHGLASDDALLGTNVLQP